MIITAIGITVLLISVAGAVWRVSKSAQAQPQQVRVLHFMLYFWVFVFIQLILAAIGYAVLVK
jgi:cytochrome b561